MSFAQSFNTHYGFPGGHITCDNIEENNVSAKTGVLATKGYFSADSEAQGGDPLEVFRVPLGNGTKTNSETGVLTRVDYDSVVGKTEAQIDAYLAGKKIFFVDTVTLGG